MGQNGRGPCLGSGLRWPRCPARAGQPAPPRGWPAEITPGDLELARQGIPSRTVSHVAIAEAQDLMKRCDRGECVQYDTRDPGGRLIEAHDNSPEARAMYDAQEELARREAIAEYEMEAGS